MHKSSDFICRTVSSSPQFIRIYISLVQSKVTYCSWSTVRDLSFIQDITEQLPSTKEGILKLMTTPQNYKTTADLTSSLPTYIGLHVELQDLLFLIKMPESSTWRINNTPESKLCWFGPYYIFAFGWSCAWNEVHPRRQIDLLYRAAWYLISIAAVVVHAYCKYGQLYQSRKSGILTAVCILACKYESDNTGERIRGKG